MGKRKSFKFADGGLISDGGLIKFINSIALINLVAFISLIALTGGVILCSTSLYSQETDPFYLRLLTQGEKSFLAQNYKEAAKELEIAAFGLHKEKKLKAKALVYLSICHYYLRDMENCENYMRQASDLVGREETANLEKEIAESARYDFQNLLIQFKLAPAEEKEAPPKMLEKPEKAEAETKKPEQKVIPKTQIQIRDKAEVERDPVKALERSIKANPRNISLYYELYELHRANNNLKAAKKTLENLVKKNPREINGFSLLGKINHTQWKYKDAEKNFEKIIELSRRVQVEESILDETKAYLILCSYLRGDRKKTQKMVTESLGIFSAEKISTLSLDIKDKEKLQSIIKTYQAQAEAQRRKARIKHLENAIKRQPRNASIYYELYDLYREEKNVKASRKVIQKLVKNNPNYMKGHFFQAKIEFFQNRFLDAQRRFNRIMTASDKSDVNRELILKSMIYTSICFHRLYKKEDVRRFIQYLYESASEEEILKMVKEEGLEAEWEKIISETGEWMK